MARKCSVTGKKAVSGNYVSHAHNITKRRHRINLVEKRIWVPEKNKWVTVKLSTRALKTIKKKGAASVLSKANLI
ncbi:MAG: 50S ribosomal protein L28 [Fibrobacterota bacterium]